MKNVELTEGLETKKKPAKKKKSDITKAADKKNTPKKKPKKKSSPLKELKELKEAKQEKINYSLDNLVKLLPDNQDITFLCVGTDRSAGDCIGPLVGTHLEELGYHVVGTLELPLQALNIEERIEETYKKYPKNFFVAIDACLGNADDIQKIFVKKDGLYPGKAVGKDLPKVGDISIKPIVNIAGFMEYNVLQSTRMHIIWELSKKIIAGVKVAMDLRSETKESKIV